jgi:hypothetical protein
MKTGDPSVAVPIRWNGDFRHNSFPGGKICARAAAILIALLPASYLLLTAGPDAGLFVIRGHSRRK